MVALLIYIRGGYRYAGKEGVQLSKLDKNETRFKVEIKKGKCTRSKYVVMIDLEETST